MAMTNHQQTCKSRFSAKRIAIWIAIFYLMALAFPITLSVYLFAGIPALLTGLLFSLFAYYLRHKDKSVAILCTALFGGITEYIYVYACGQYWGSLQMPQSILTVSVLASASGGILAAFKLKSSNRNLFDLRWQMVANIFYFGIWAPWLGLFIFFLLGLLGAMWISLESFLLK